eukprot:8427920-Lingulodinium_polyedra.AAC.1
MAKAVPAIRFGESGDKTLPAAVQQRILRFASNDAYGVANRLTTEFEEEIAKTPLASRARGPRV